MSGSNKPLGSTDFQDLPPNISNTDLFVNSPATSFANRTTPDGNVITRTLAGINATADAAISEFKLKKLGNYADGPHTLTDGFEYVIYNGDAFFAVNPQYTTDPATYPDPNTDTNLVLENSYATKEFVTTTVGNPNYIYNHNFITKTPDETITPPDPTPRPYSAGEQVFLGWFIGTAAVGLTYANGVVNATSGTIYTEVQKANALEFINDFVASIANTSLNPSLTGVSFSLINGKYRIVVDLAVANDVFSVKLETGSQATRHDVSKIKGLEIDVLDFGMTPNSRDASSKNKDIFESLLRMYMHKGISFTFPVGDMYIDDIDVSDISLVGLTFAVKGVTRPSMMGHWQFNGSSIIFMSDETSIGRVGLNLGEGTNVSIESMKIGGLGDGRNATGDFIGIKSRGAGSRVVNSSIESLVTAFEWNDTGYVVLRDNHYRFVGTVYNTIYVLWPFGTTLSSSNSYGVTCEHIFNIPGMFHSSWTNDIYEYCKTPIKDCSLGCYLINVYFENNTDGGVVTDQSDRIYIQGGFIADPVKDGIFLEYDPVKFGYDHGGISGLVGGNNMQARRFKTVNAVGQDAGYLSSSRLRSLGQTTMELFEEDESLVGTVLGHQHFEPTVDGNRSIGLSFGTSYIGSVPAGWTITKTGVGEWTVVFNSDIKTPNISISLTGSSTSTSIKCESQLYMTGVNWASFRSASGFIVKTTVDGLSSDSVIVFATVVY